MMKKRHTNSLEKTLLEEKRRILVSSIFEYWKKQDELNLILFNNLKDLGVENSEYRPLPFDLSSYIYLLNDGAVFLRFKTENCIKGMHTITSNDSVDEFIKKGLIIPRRDYNVVLPNIRVINCSFENTTFHVGGKEYFVEYLIYNHIKYDDIYNIPSLSTALIDFRLTLLGINLNTDADITDLNEIKSSNNDKIEILKTKIDEFKEILSNNVNEETIQIFLKNNPIILKVTSFSIPKQKLGDDFITDFVLLNLLDKGKVYTFVELEKSTHKILTKDGTLTSEVNKAIKQVNDWNIWLETNKSYLQNKLPNLETPKFLIVIGRSNMMTETDKERFRSYCRNYTNIDIMSYDDLLSQANELINDLESIKS